jgi:uncharacterized protein YjbJ (UPF0337 family)
VLSPRTSHSVGLHFPNFLTLYYSKAAGQYHSLKGTVVENIGDVTGAKSWTESGSQEHASGETEYKAAQAKGYAEGLKDNISGKKDTVVGAITGDRQQETAGMCSCFTHLQPQSPTESTLR